MTFVQPELPLEWDTMTYDHYTVEIRKGPEFDESQVLRTHNVKTVDDALGLIEGFRDTYNQRNGVSWQDDEVNAEGKLYGLAGGEVYVISCTPPLTTELQ